MKRGNLLFLRHGEAEGNREGILLGQYDAPLTAEGERQASFAAKTVQRLRVDSVVSSDLLRARETAARCAEALSLPVHPDAGLRERNLGRWQGMTRQKALATWPEFDGEEVPEGESRREFRERVVAACEAIASLSPGQTVLVVSHSGAISEFLRHVLRIPALERKAFQVENCSFTLVVPDGSGWRMSFFGLSATGFPAGH